MKSAYYIFSFLTFFILLSTCKNNISSKDLDKIQNIDTLSNNDLRLVFLKENFDDFIYHFCFDYNFRFDRSKGIKPSNNKFYFNSDYQVYLLPTNNISHDNSQFMNSNEIYYSILSKYDSLFTEFIFSMNDSLWFLSSINKRNLNNYNLHQFFSFLTDFCKDSIFQRHHTRFPLKTTFLDYKNDYSDTTVYLESKDCITTDLFFNDTLSLIHPKIEFNHINNIAIRFLGMDNGIRIEYYFSLINYQWKLVEVKDLST